MAEELDGTENTIAFDSLEKWCEWGWGIYDKLEVLVVLVGRMDSCRYIPPGSDSMTRFYGPFLPDEVGVLKTDEGAHRELQAGEDEQILCDHQLIGWFVIPADYSGNMMAFNEWRMLTWKGV